MTGYVPVEQIESLLRLLGPAEMTPTALRMFRSVCEAHSSPPTCPEHKPKQHRDGKPPWCRVCGMDADGQEPVSTLGSK